jgi:hypothetical protein
MQARGTAVGQERDNGGTPAGQERDTGSTGGADPAGEAGQERDSSGTDVGQGRDSSGDRRVGSTLHTPHSTEQQATSASEEPQLFELKAEEPEPEPAPAWMAGLRAKNRKDNPPKPPKSVTSRQLYDVVCAALEPIRSTSSKPKSDAANAVMALWSAMSADEGEWLPVDEARRRMVLLARAAKQCPHPVFARELRAEDWDRGTDRSSMPASVFRINPPPESGGASWSVRLDIAEQWAASAHPDLCPDSTVSADRSPALTAWQDQLPRLPETCGSGWFIPYHRGEQHLATDPAEHKRRAVVWTEGRPGARLLDRAVREGLDATRDAWIAAYMAEVSQ